MWYNTFRHPAGVAELADAPDLGSGGLRAGSSPVTRTKKAQIGPCGLAVLFSLTGLEVGYLHFLIFASVSMTEFVLLPK